MKEDVKKYILGCRNCQLRKLVRIKTKQPMILADTPGTAFDKLSMDIMGPLSTTRSEKSYILTIQDLLIKYLLAILLKEANAISVADAFTKNFICIFSSSRAWLTYRETPFINSLIRKIVQKFRITEFKTSAYKHQSNGLIERSHQVL